MRIGCNKACACLVPCYESAKQTFAATLLILDEIQSNPEAFQKAAILAESIIQGINFIFHTNYLPELIKILDVAQSFDFYGFCKIPHYLFHIDTRGGLKNIHFLERLDDAIFIVVDVGCIPAFLQDWSLIDLTWCSEAIGRVSCLAWATETSLDDWVRRGMCLGFIVKASEALRKLYVKSLIPVEKRNAHLIVAASVAECFYNGSILLRSDPRWITFFALFAKSLGLLQILLAPKETSS